MFKRSYYPLEQECTKCNSELVTYLVTTTGTVVMKTEVIQGKHTLTFDLQNQSYLLWYLFFFIYTFSNNTPTLTCVKD